jgi:hypothetical protein
MKPVANTHALLLLLPLLWSGYATGAEFQTSTPSDESLWFQIRTVGDLGELRGMQAEFAGNGAGRVLRLQTTASAQTYAWADLPAPSAGWGLETRRSIEAVVSNPANKQVEVLLWVVSQRGWEAVGDFANLPPSSERAFRCDLRQTFPDGTPKVDPGLVNKLRIMVRAKGAGTRLEISRPVATGRLPVWVRPEGRLEVPGMEQTEAGPAPGRRVRCRLPGDNQPDLYFALYLPGDWQAGRKFPVIVEYPGNIFYVPACYSTGRPEQCVIGYGMTRGRGSLWVSLPFIDRKTGQIAENGWGNPDDTAEYAERVVELVCRKFGGDAKNVVLTGFSRGAIACGYIGLRNDRIARLWKGFHACQHYDGDGWNGADMAGAMQRVRRFAGSSIFQTDNSEQQFQPLMEASHTKAIFVKSGLGAHSCAMFLDNRPSTEKLRQWYTDLVQASK